MYRRRRPTRQPYTRLGHQGLGDSPVPYFLIRTTLTGVSRGGACMYAVSQSHFDLKSSFLLLITLIVSVSHFSEILPPI